MRVLLFSDLHCHNHNQFSTRLDTGLNSRFNDCLNVLRQARKICKKREIDEVYFLGDLFHSRTRLDVDVFTMTYRELRQLKEDGPNIVLLCGNHDQNMRVGDITSLEALSEFVSVVSKPLSYGIFDWIPYTADVEEFRAALSNCRGEILFLHQPIKEALPGATNLTGKTIVLGEDFGQQHKLIISGDIHKRQTLLGGRFQYLGSPLQLTFGDRGEQRGFTILDTTTLEMEFIESDAPKFYWFRYDFKEHPSIDFDRDFVRYSYLAENEAVAFLKTKYPRVQFDKLRDGLDAMESAPQIELLTDDRKLLEEYMERVGIGDLDKERLLTVGLQELSGAMV